MMVEERGRKQEIGFLKAEMDSSFAMLSPSLSHFFLWWKFCKVHDAVHLET